MRIFRHKFSGRVLQRRLLSTVESGGSANTADAAKKSNSLKYMIVGVPTLILGTIVTDIVCNVNHRKALEKLSPTFVGLVRENYGFDDEDPVELARIKFVKEQLAKPVDMRVRTEGGEEVRLTGVSGTQSVTQALETLASAPPSPQLASVDFAYGSNDSSQDHMSAENGAGKSSADAGSGEPSVRPDHSGWNTQRPSVWATLPGEPLTRPTYAEKEEDMRRYEDYYGDFSKGVHAYAENGNGLLPVGENKAGTSQRRARPTVSKRPSAASSAAAEADLARIRARQRIEELQRDIQHLEGEKRLGVREIDAVEAEIRGKRQQITDVQRRHLNYFYYF